jgi:dihydroceramidase
MPSLPTLGYRVFLADHQIPADELSMHLLTTPLLYRILSFKASPDRARLIGIILSVLFTIVMVVHMVMDEFLLHAASFGLAVYLIGSRTPKLIPAQVTDLKLRKALRYLSFFGCCMLLYFIKE